MPFDNHQIHLEPLSAANEDVRNVVIGWDPPLDTYFVQIHGANEDELLVWLGTRPRELDLDAAIDAIRPYAEVPADLRERLLKDHDARPARR